MYIAYNAFEDEHCPLPDAKEAAIKSQLDGYQLACEKYAIELAAIRNYFPGWMPALNFQH